MIENKRTYMAIDLKSFYASVECIDHDLDPLNANLVVADNSRTDKTICLAVSPALKQFGIPGRPRLFQVEQIVRKLNRERADKVSTHLTKYSSINRQHLLNSQSLRIGYKVVKPRMNFYMHKSTEIYGIYLRFIEAKNIHVYSIDEVLMDVTDYLKQHDVTPHTLAKTIIQQIQSETGITATAGIGTNLFLAKVAMDIVAKHIPADTDGVRIAQMNEQQYRKLLWAHQPLTDFWRVGRGYAARLEKLGLNTMGDIARCSLGSLSDEYNEEILYHEFGKNAELLIDHAWGHETATLEDIKKYRSDDHGLYSSQVLMKPTSYDDGLKIVRGMSDTLALDLVQKKVLSNRIGLIIDYDITSLQVNTSFSGKLVEDWYGRKTPKPAHTATKLTVPTSSQTELRHIFISMYENIVDNKMLIRRVTVTANHLVDENKVKHAPKFTQTNLFGNPEEEIVKDKVAEEKRARDHKIQETILDLQKRFGNRNVILKASDLEEGSTTKERNNQIGGHHA
ncbi:LytTR family transcriptional regulator [Companilactobacillus ginsenosidimutans]|uniref:LytTR family transcriptional regulator n=1 Tax=Companilactobacillus ginsenosidimutans TaxID=1007676 RepID=A0A0H4QML3_9LACO|nr:LytTR family transcriptional regulator [Companilactobacillus ginsenosidimutans]AKP67933.1 LytTR family transcriptional regulator [Companilactobacillus ginsenosidimutans]